MTRDVRSYRLLAGWAHRDSQGIRPNRSGTQRKLPEVSREAAQASYSLDSASLDHRLDMMNVKQRENRRTTKASAWTTPTLITRHFDDYKHRVTRWQ
jgi:hypothetical protein